VNSGGHPRPSARVDRRAGEQGRGAHRDLRWDPAPAVSSCHGRMCWRGDASLSRLRTDYSTFTTCTMNDPGLPVAEGGGRVSDLQGEIRYSGSPTTRPRYGRVVFEVARRPRIPRRPVALHPHDTVERRVRPRSPRSSRSFFLGVGPYYALASGSAGDRSASDHPAGPAAGVVAVPDADRPRCALRLARGRRGPAASAPAKPWRLAWVCATRPNVSRHCSAARGPAGALLASRPLTSPAAEVKALDHRVPG